MTNPILRLFSKIVAFSTLFLIFVGGMVTSTNSGLSVPDWPLSYGTLFPPMVGGVFYEHGHRMVASLVGLLTLILSVLLWKYEKRGWIIKLGFVALAAVIMQGILGGITVKFFLPPAVSVSHGVLAQTFFLLTIFIAYTESKERANRFPTAINNKPLAVWSIIAAGSIYLQLIFGAIMRHTKSGLAIPDFPLMGGEWIPMFDQKMLSFINYWRFEHDLSPVTWGQVHIHLLHRVWAAVILATVCFLQFSRLKSSSDDRIQKNIFYLFCLIVSQIVLGMSVIWSVKQPVITSLHVVTGAASLGMATLLVLRVLPIQYKEISLR